MKNAGRSYAAIALGLIGCLAAATGLSVVPTARAATTFVVNKIGDQSDNNFADNLCDSSTTSGRQCTLRAAIQQSNATSGTDTINFNITSSSKTIRPNSALPPITGTVTINGYSQSGASQNTKQTGSNAVLKVVVDGTNAGADARGLELEGAGSLVKGLVIQLFSGAGIFVGGSDHVVSGNFIGTNAAGTLARPNGVGVGVTGSGHLIGGGTPAARNVLSGNTFEGIDLVDASDISILDNYIGVKDTGDGALGNGDVGVHVIRGGNIRIGAAGDGNVIADNGDAGILTLDTLVITIHGNRIGTNAAGTVAMGNSSHGVKLISTTDSDVGGPGTGEGNVISGNFGHGVALNIGSSGNWVAGNRIGTKADGSGDLGNSSAGVHVESPTNIVGGPASGAANVISGNNGNGLQFYGADARFNTVQGNVIKANGADGVEARMGPNHVLANVIFGNVGVGVKVTASGNGVEIRGNQIFANGKLGIDLVGGPESGAGVSFNDVDDPDTGANALQNSPVLTAAIRSQATNLTTVAGSLNSNGSTDFTIELFLVLAVDPSNRGEGQVLLASRQITTSAGGDRTFSFVLGNLPQGSVLTTTATSEDDNTSEFSSNLTVVPGP